MGVVKKIAIFGAGSFGNEVALLLINHSDLLMKFDLIGFFDDTLPVKTEVKYGRIIGGIEALNTYPEELAVVIGIGNSNSLENIRESIKNPFITFPNIVNNNVLFLDKNSTSFGEGNIFLGNSFISYDVRIGNFNIFNTGVCLGHHVNVSNYNVFHPNVQVSGNVTIGSSNTFGLNSAILPKKRIGEFNTIAPGSIITKQFSDRSFLVGNPARNLKI